MTEPSSLYSDSIPPPEYQETEGIQADEQPTGQQQPRSSENPLIIASHVPSLERNDTTQTYQNNSNELSGTAATVSNLVLNSTATTSMISPPWLTSNVRQPPGPLVQLPNYEPIVVPTSPVRYQFSPIGFNGMLLLPVMSSQVTRPPYYISIRMNVFMPLSYITTIHRGGSEDGDVVGEFELGIIESPGRLEMGGLNFPIHDHISQEGGRDTGLWQWVMPLSGPPLGYLKRGITWDFSKRPCVCKGDIGGIPTRLARYLPHLGQPGGFALPKYQSSIEVAPEGLKYFDDILISLLIIERKRLAPISKGKDLKYLFN